MQGRVALIPGGSRSIGYAIGERLRAGGVRPAIAAREPTKTLVELKEKGMEPLASPNGLEKEIPSHLVKKTSGSLWAPRCPGSRRWHMHPQARARLYPRGTASNIAHSRGRSVSTHSRGRASHAGLGVWPHPLHPLHRLHPFLHRWQPLTPHCPQHHQSCPFRPHPGFSKGMGPLGNQGQRAGTGFLTNRVHPSDLEPVRPRPNRRHQNPLTPPGHIKGGGGRGFPLFGGGGIDHRTDIGGKRGAMVY